MSELVLLSVLVPTIVSFIIGILITPSIANQLYQHRMWKKTAGKGVGYGGGGTPLFDQLHKEKDTNTPRMGGIIIWGSVLITTVLFAVLHYFAEAPTLTALDFLTREQTWLPLLALFAGAIIGFVDDVLVVRGTGKHFAGGLPLSQRLLLVFAVALFIGYWFYQKLDVSTVSFFTEQISLGIWFVPFFVFVAVCVYMSSVIDGIDGLSGGVFITIFGAYTGVALLQDQFDIAALCAVISGATMAFLWFNIPPARFYMTETGIMALTLSLTVIAFMTDTLVDGVGVTVLPIIGFVLLATVAANTLQILSKKLFKKKVFLVAPLHHHFEALGWPAYKVTMRYWIISALCAVIGVVIVASV